MENIIRLGKLKKVVTGTDAEHIIKYIKENAGTTKDRVAKDMQNQKICSRLTTLKVIDTLLSIGMIIDKRQGKYFHSLYHNEHYDFSDYGMELLQGCLDDIKDAWGVLTGDALLYESLFRDLKVRTRANIIKYKRKHKKS